jgi:transcriptional regulator
MNFKGTLPTLILEALVRESSHGYRIAQGIKERSKGVLDFKEGTLYPALHKLENEGLVESYEEVENGRLRRYYRITKSGRAVLAKDRAEWRKLSRAVTVILEEHNDTRSRPLAGAGHTQPVERFRRTGEVQNEKTDRR